MKRSQRNSNRRTRATKAALVLDTAGIARVVSLPAQAEGRELFVFNTDNARACQLATVAALFVNARECHPDRAARMLRQLTRKVEPVQQQPKRAKRKGKGNVEGSRMTRHKTRTPEQEAKHAAMRARYQPLAG